MKSYRAVTLLFIILFISICPSVHAILEKPDNQHSSIQQDNAVFRTKAVRQGMSIEMSVEPVAGADKKRVLEGEYTDLNISMKDVASGLPIKAMFPAVWVDQRKEFKGEKSSSRCG